VCVCERERAGGTVERGSLRQRMLAPTRAVQEGGAHSKFRVCAKYLLCAGREGKYVCECVCLCMCGYEHMFKRVLFAYKTVQETLEHTLIHAHKGALTYTQIRTRVTNHRRRRLDLKQSRLSKFPTSYHGNPEQIKDVFMGVPKSSNKLSP